MNNIDFGLQKKKKKVKASVCLNLPFKPILNKNTCVRPSAVKSLAIKIAHLKERKLSGYTPEK